MKRKNNKEWFNLFNLITNLLWTSHTSHPRRYLETPNPKMFVKLRQKLQQYGECICVYGPSVAHNSRETSPQHGASSDWASLVPRTPLAVTAIRLLSSAGTCIHSASFFSRHHLNLHVWLLYRLYIWVLLPKNRVNVNDISLMHLNCFCFWDTCQITDSTIHMYGYFEWIYVCFLFWDTCQITYVTIHMHEDLSPSLSPEI